MCASIANAVVVPSPPDLDGAVGSNYVVTATGIGVQIQDRTGTVVTNMSFETFWTNNTGVVFEPFTGFASDPRVHYDPYDNRWMITASYSPASTNAALLVGVSATDDPTGAWYRHRIPADTNLQYWLDFPNSGFNKNWLAVHANLIPFTSTLPRIGKLFVLNKQNLYTNGPLEFTEFVLSSNETTMVPAVTYDPTEETLYLIDIPPGGIVPTVSTLTGPIGAEQFTLNVSTAAAPLDIWSPTPFTFVDFAPQLGTTNKIFSFTEDLSHCVYRNGSLWFSHTIYLPALSPTHSSVQWWEIQPDASVLQRGRIDDPDGFRHYANASLAVNAHNDVLVGYSSFSTAQYAEANYSFHAAEDPPGLLRPPFTLKAGEGPFERPDFLGLNRWGDHSAAVVDPVDDTALWTVQEYAAGPSNRWSTWWGQILPPEFADVAVSITASPVGEVPPGTDVTYTLLATNRGPSTAENLIVYCELPGGAAWVSSTQTVGSSTCTNGILTTMLGPLGNGLTETITFTATLLTPGESVCTATISTSLTDTNLNDNIRTVTHCVPYGVLPDVWINEIHYDDANGLFAVDEGVEIAGSAGTSLEGLVLTFYEGTGGGLSYTSLVLTGTIDNETNGYGALWFPVSFLHDGGFGFGGDGISLSLPCDNTVVEFLSYEGSFTAGDGPAAGLTATDIGVEEFSQTPSGYSLQKIGMGTNQSFFAWAPPAPNSPGSINARQLIQPPEYADLALLASISPSMVTQGESVVYSLTATNQGPDSAEGVVIELALPLQITFAGADLGAGTCRFTNQSVICSLSSSLPPGSSASLSITGIVTEAGLHTAHARVYANQNENTPADNAASLEACADFSSTPLIWINEFHYRDSSFEDQDEGVEIAGLAGTDLAGYQLVLYDGLTGDPYNTIALTGIIDDEGNGFGALWFPIMTMQEGKLFPPLGEGDGIALALPCTGVIQFISYHGAFTAASGAAAGLLSEDVGLIEPSNNPTNLSLQLQGIGSAYDDCFWAGALTNSRGLLNANQVLVCLSDTDFDGMPNDWELLHFGDPTITPPGDDADFDGFSNLEEYIADTLPTNALSFFQITAIASGENLVIRFDTSSNRVYDVDMSIGAIGIDWSPILEDQPGTGGEMSVTNSSTETTKRFRASVALPSP